MKTTLLVTITHPKGESAHALIRDCVHAVLSDINDDLAEGWEVEYTDGINGVPFWLTDKPSRSHVRALLSAIDPTTPENQSYGWSLITQLMEHFQIRGTTWARQDADQYADRPLTDKEWESVYNGQEWRTLDESTDMDTMVIRNALFYAGVPVNGKVEPF